MQKYHYCYYYYYYFFEVAVVCFVSIYADKVQFFTSLAYVAAVAGSILPFSSLKPKDYFVLTGSPQGRCVHLKVEKNGPIYGWAVAFKKSSVRQGEEKYSELYPEPKLLPYNVPTGVPGQQEHPARVGSMSPLSQHPPSLVGRLSWRILPFQSVEGPREKTEREPVPEWTSWSHWAPRLRSVLPWWGGHTEGPKLLLIILMSDGTDFTDWYLMGVGRGWAWRGCGGDRPCQSDGLTDRWAVGRAGRGHPRPSWANMGCPPPPDTHTQETLWQLNGAILSVWKRRGLGRVGVGSEDDHVKLLVNLIIAIKGFFSFVSKLKIFNLLNFLSAKAKMNPFKALCRTAVCPICAKTSKSKLHIGILCRLLAAPGCF